MYFFFVERVSFTVFPSLTITLSWLDRVHSSVHGDSKLKVGERLICTCVDQFFRIKLVQVTTLFLEIGPQANFFDSKFFIQIGPLAKLSGGQFFFMTSYL